jgi:hypothetical protein
MMMHLCIIVFFAIAGESFAFRIMAIRSFSKLSPIGVSNRSIKECMAIPGGINFLVQEWSAMIAESYALFNQTSWELTSRDSYYIKAYSKLFEALDWLTIKLVDDKGSFYNANKADVADAFRMESNISAKYEMLQSAKVRAIMDGENITVCPAVIWAGLKHYGVVGVQTSMVGNEEVFRSGRIGVYKRDLLSYVTEAADLVVHKLPREKE